VDFRGFLAPREPVVLPYVGGTRVDAADRRLRVDTAIAPGWWRFRIDGRRAVPMEPAAAVDLGALPALRGHWAGGWIFVSGRELGRIALPPDEEPAPLSRITARRWYSGDLLLESIDFEDDAELEARRALEEQRPLREVRGVVPSLRAAFGYALAAAVGRSIGVPVSPREAAPNVLAFADGGADTVRTFLEILVEHRQRQQVRSTAGRAAVRVRPGDPIARADAALDAAGARLFAHRRAGHGLLEVTFECEGERIVCVVDPGTLHVFDAGICLSGADEELTLDSLPSVVREAIRTDRLHITRHG